MSTAWIFRVVAVSVCAGTLLAACGSSTISSASPTPSASTTTTGVNPALKVAMVPSDLPASAAGFTQTGDGLLGSTPSTDARIFASPDSTTKVEIDVAVDTSASAASSDYTAFKSAAAIQVPTQTRTSSPAVGSRADEYVGTSSGGQSVVALAFVEGSVICVVTAQSSIGPVDPVLVEAIATAQVSKIRSAGL